MLVGTLELQAGSNPEQLGYPAGRDEAISIVPVVGGAGGGNPGLTAVLAGVALVAFSLALPGVGAVIGGTAMTAIGVTGGGLILTGVAQMLTPVPEVPSGEGSTGTQQATHSAFPVFKT